MWSSVSERVRSFVQGVDASEKLEVNSGVSRRLCADMNHVFIVCIFV